MRDDSMLGSTIAGFRIERLLGRGGMGVVYVAEQGFPRRRVALKLLAPELSQDSAFRDRFIRESNAAASLDHPNAIPIYGAGEDDGVLWIAMRLVEGEDLGRLLQREAALAPERAVHICSQVAAVLDAAGDIGLVHRDVKPGNILVGRGDHVYLIDFGLIRRAEPETSFTRTGQFIGSVDYAAPELIRGEDVDHRADVYSLGCVLFECLTGGPPYQRDSEAAVLYAHLNDPPPRVTEKRPQLSRGFDDVVARALAKSPEQRYQRPGEEAAAAREALRTVVDFISHSRHGLGTRPVGSGAERGPDSKSVVGRHLSPTRSGSSIAASSVGVFGRSGEMAAVRQFVAAVPAGPIALLVEGEAGIGKTALWKEAVALAAETSCQVLEARPVESDVGRSSGSQP